MAGNTVLRTRAMIECYDNFWWSPMVLLPGYEWLEAVPGRRGGRPTVKGTRVTVDDILDMLAAGWKPEEVAEELDIPLGAVYEALRFASRALKRVVVVAETIG